MREEMMGRAIDVLIVAALFAGQAMIALGIVPLPQFAA
jgi:hypothetical protein